MIPTSFSLQELTAAINDAPALPARLANLGLFQEDGLTTTSLGLGKMRIR
ncbi:major capsid protein [Castellaniella sp.]